MVSQGRWRGWSGQKACAAGGTGPKAISKTGPLTCFRVGAKESCSWLVVLLLRGEVRLLMSSWLMVTMTAMAAFPLVTVRAAF